MTGAGLKDGSASDADRQDDADRVDYWAGGSFWECGYCGEQTRVDPPLAWVDRHDLCRVHAEFDAHEGTALGDCALCRELGA